MKLITAIVSKEDARTVNKALVAAGFTVTQLATQGGFLLSHNVTMLIGTEDARVNECLALFEKHSRQRKEIVPSGAGYSGIDAVPAMPLEVTVGGATVFVTNVERFEKL